METLTALKKLAAEHKKHCAFVENIEASSMVSLPSVWPGDMQIYKGLVGSGLKLKKELRSDVIYSYEYTIIVDGVKFSELTED
jgi:hypothetical protein